MGLMSSTGKSVPNTNQVTHFVFSAPCMREHLRSLISQPFFCPVRIARCSRWLNWRDDAVVAEKLWSFGSTTWQCSILQRRLFSPFKWVCINFHHYTHRGISNSMWVQTWNPFSELRQQFPSCICTVQKKTIMSHGWSLYGFFLNKAPSLNPKYPIGICLILLLSAFQFLDQIAERKCSAFLFIKKTLHTVFSIYPTSAYHESVRLNLFQNPASSTVVRPTAKQFCWAWISALMHVISKWRNCSFYQIHCIIN